MIGITWGYSKMKILPDITKTTFIGWCMKHNYGVWFTTYHQKCKHYKCKHYIDKWKTKKKKRRL